MNCENCGVPQGALLSEGQTIQITRRAENRFKLDRKTTVWACTDECAIQALAISKYGPATHKWPITLSQFRAVTKLPKEQ